MQLTDLKISGHLLYGFFWRRDFSPDSLLATQWIQSGRARVEQAFGLVGYSFKHSSKTAIRAFQYGERFI